MKKSSKILIFAILCTVCLVLIACAKIDSIYFETEPRKTYVQGQEFTLDEATLVAMAKNKNKPIDMEGVTVSGYNKDQLGQQTVTITYEGQTLEFKVTVIPRIALDGVTKDYFVGDTFDKSKGRLRIADDNANTKSINMSESAVTVEGFDSTTPGKKTLTVKYGNYTSTFTVTVYTAETVELTSVPKRNSYYSHNTISDFVTTGAFFTVTANNGSLTRMVEATPEMVTGFDPSAATVDNMNSPLKQTVKFNYLGKSFDFKITIRFSGVSYALAISQDLETRSITPENAEKADKEIALDALFKYADLTPADQNLIDSDVIQKLLEIGIPYGAQMFEEEAAKFCDTIQFETIKETDEETEVTRFKGKINVIATTYDAVKADLEALQDVKVPLLEMAESLYKLKEAFYSQTIGEKTVDEILGTVFEPNAMDDVTKIFKYLLELYDILKDVPDDWATTEPKLENYGDIIRQAVATINASDYNAFDNSATLYSILSTWRAQNDYFDIIYAYYLYNDRSTMISTSSPLWEKVYMPGPLHELYYLHNFACQEAMNMKVGDDTSKFMYYYARTNEVAEQIKNGDNQLYKDIYNAFKFDALTKDYLFFGTKEIGKDSENPVAYVYYASSLLGNPTYEKLLEDFFALFKLSLQDGFSFQDEETIKEFQESAFSMLNSYASFTPNERFAFLSSLHCDYRISTSEQLALAHTVGEDGILTINNYFSYLLYNTYRKVLTPEAYDVFSRLMEASEMYAVRYHNAKLYDGFTDSKGVERLGFLATMEAIMANAAKLSEEEKAPFAPLLEAMTRAYEIETEEPYVPTLTAEQQALFAELMGAIENFYKFYSIANSEEVDTAADRFKYYIIAFSAFERAKALATEIRAINSEDVLYTLLYVPAFEIAGKDGTTLNATFDYMLDDIGSTFYLKTLRMSTEDGSNVCTIYINYDIAGFLNDAYDVFLAVFNGKLDDSYAEKVQKLESYNLNYNQRETLKKLGAWEYYEAAIAYFNPDDKA